MNQLEKTTFALAAAGLGAWWLSRYLPARAHYDFRDKVVFLSGGSRGLGLVLARQLAREGARLALCARDEEELQRAGADVALHGPWPFTQPCDVTDPHQVQESVRAVETHVGPVDVLINDAGTIQVGPLESITRADVEDALAVNFWGAFHTTQAVLPSMLQRRQGRIVNISSIGGKISIPHLLPYSISKFALVGYSQGLRAELTSRGIVVTTVCPGLMRTGSPPNALFKGKNQAEYAWFSILDSLPFVTLSAEEAAQQILDACRRGDAEAVLSLPAQAAVKLHALFPELVAHLLSLTARLLPGPGGIGTQSRTGQESKSWASPSFLTTLTDEAAEQNNQLASAVR